MIWWLEDPKRSKQEREQLNALAAVADWLVPRGWRIDQDLHLIWEADIVLADEIFAFSLRYPNHFPYSPPLIVPRNPSERWSMHQYGSGELCLEHGPDNWRSELTGADMVRSAHRLLSTERSHSGEASVAPSRHETTIGQDLRGKYTRFLISRELDATLSTLPEAGVWTADAVVFFHDESNVNIIATIDRGETLGKWQEHLPDSVRSAYSRQVMIARWGPQDAFPAAGSLNAFRDKLALNGVVMSSPRFVLLLRGSELRAYSVSADDDKVLKVSVIPAQPEMPRLDEEHARLSGVKAGVVGCGSLGSKVAVSLARSGVGRFLLVDHDLLFPDNLVRHDLDWRDAGRHKVDGVAEKIQMVNPGAVCEKRGDYLGGQESGGTTESLIEALGQCDLLVDATAEPAAFNYLAGASVISEKPLLWAEVFPGGSGGAIARHRPGLEPDPQSMRSAIEHWWREHGTPAERPAGRYQGGEHTPVIADDADVTVIAAHAARLAIDTLLRREPSVFPHSVYVIGLARGLIFQQPFETYPIDVGSAPAKAEEDIDEAEQKAEVERVIDLLKEYRDADSAGPAGG